MNVRKLKDLLKTVEDESIVELISKRNKLILTVLEGEYLETQRYEVFSQKDSLHNKRVDYKIVEYEKDLEITINRLGKDGFRISGIIQPTPNDPPKIIMFRRYWYGSTMERQAGSM